MKEYYQAVTEMLNINTTHMLRLFEEMNFFMELLLSIVVFFIFALIINGSFTFFIKRQIKRLDKEMVEKQISEYEYSAIIPLIRNICEKNIVFIITFCIFLIACLFMINYVLIIAILLAIVFICATLSTLFELKWILNAISLKEILDLKEFKQLKKVIIIYNVALSSILFFVLFIGDHANDADAKKEILKVEQEKQSQEVVEKLVADATPIKYVLPIENIDLEKLNTFNLTIDGKVQADKNVLILTNNDIESNVLIPVGNHAITKELIALEEQVSKKLPGSKLYDFNRYKLKIGNYPITKIDYFYNVHLEDE